MTTTENLKRLLADHARLMGERDRHEQMAISLQAEESKLMDTVNLENKAEFEKVSQLRLRREIVPRKIKNFEEAAERAKADIAAECSKVTTLLLNIIRTKTNALTGKIAKALEPFFPTKTAATEAAESIVHSTPAGAELINPSARLKNNNFVNREVFAKADELLKMAPIVEAVEI